MQNASIPQTLADFQKEFSQVKAPENAVTFNPPTPETIAIGEGKAIPLITICPPRINTGDFFDVLKQVAGVIKKYKPELVPEVAQIEAALPEGTAERDLFVSQVFNPEANLLDDLGQDLPSETFGFLINHAAKPFMIQYGQEVGKLYDLEQWLKGECPVCGGRPTMALLERDTGKRLLYCGVCEIKWRFQRLGCPYCGSSESQFFTVEGMEKYRIYFCNQCHGYIKTIDGERTSAAMDLFWEDINTVQLDILAMREGYLNQQVDQP